MLLDLPIVKSEVTGISLCEDSTQILFVRRFNTEPSCEPDYPISISHNESVTDLIFHNFGLYEPVRP